MSVRRWPSQAYHVGACRACRTHRSPMTLPALDVLAERALTIVLLSLAGALALAGLFALGLLMVVAMRFALEGLAALAHLLGRA